MHRSELPALLQEQQTNLADIQDDKLYRYTGVGYYRDIAVGHWVPVEDDDELVVDLPKDELSKGVIPSGVAYGSDVAYGFGRHVKPIIAEIIERLGIFCSDVGRDEIDDDDVQKVLIGWKQK